MARNTSKARILGECTRFVRARLDVLDRRNRETVRNGADRYKEYQLLCRQSTALHTGLAGMTEEQLKAFKVLIIPG